MNIDVRVSRKYAQAFLNVFDARLAPEVFGHIQSFKAVLADHKDALFFLSLPHISDERKLDVIRSVVSLPLAQEMLVSLVRLLIAHKRSEYIVSILGLVCQLYREQHKIMVFTISSAHELEQAQLTALQAFLADKTSHAIEYNVKINKKLIAGIRMQSSTYLWEYSIRKQLATINYLMIR